MQWGLAEDEIGKHMMALFSSANMLRAEFPSLRSGGVQILHEDRPNGVVAFERMLGVERIVAVVNAGRSGWQVWYASI